MPRGFKIYLVWKGKERRERNLRKRNYCYYFIYYQDFCIKQKEEKHSNWYRSCSLNYYYYHRHCLIFTIIRLIIHAHRFRHRVCSEIVSVFKLCQRVEELISVQRFESNETISFNFKPWWNRDIERGTKRSESVCSDWIRLIKYRLKLAVYS